MIRKTHQTIKAVTEDIERFSFNTAIAKLMEFVNFIYPNINDNSSIRHSAFGIRHLLLLLAPFAPHLAEELWHQLGNKESICKQPWPVYDPALARENELTIAVQVNGKLRDTIVVAADAKEELVKVKGAGQREN